MEAEEVYVLVEYGFEYRTKDGTVVSIHPNERYVLLGRTNEHWWHVRRSGDARPFYVPAQYVKELPPMAAPQPLYPEEMGSDLESYGYPRLRADPRPAETSKGRRREAQERREPEEPSAHIYLNLQELQREAAASGTAPQPHSPQPHSPPHSADWETHRDAESGHLFYYNPSTGETTWDCPFEQDRDTASPGASPPAWGQRTEWGGGRALPHNSVTGEGAWDPHGVGDDPRDAELGLMPYSPMEHRPPTPEADYPELSPDELEAYPEEDYSPPGSCPYQWGAVPYPPPRRHQELAMSPRWYGHGPPTDHEQFSTETVLAGGLHQRASSSSSQDSALFGTPASPGLREEKLKSLDKAGVLNRTKTMDRGKRIRKNWSSSWTVLEGGILTFFKDSKHSSAGALRHPTTLTTPEHTVELRGAAVSWASKEKSSKKHVLELRTREGSEFLIQHDSEQIVATWHRAIADSIARMGSDVTTEEDAESGTEFGSREKLGAAAPGDGDSSKVRNKLRKFLQRRPTLQSLRERGYIKDQVFGCSLQALCEREHGTVPRFVQQCIHSVERRGLDIDGLYRVSGNLATIQKLRYKVDHEEHLDLDDGRWEDVHVITGALKLFFRELPEPLVPFAHFDKFIAAIKMQDPVRRGRCVRDLVRSLPPANHDTMKVLFGHLCRVIEFKEENRMSVQSVAIVFGPTLLRAPSEEGSMAVHMVFQNQVVELILNQYGHIFPEG
ncbi:rho GTPase-activating protein 27-like isoform X3 [Numida meleagris]|uniref:rho GTPase-activating protein 27-like isoform X3 n=1 Tax=Numida meleagris TaxID=8996 RepID=UPI000B3E36A1|nr:rho GTPase-activating protein 27-like isoform X3 [Numida meleagris]